MTADSLNFQLLHLPGKITSLHPDQFNHLEWGLAETATWWGLGR